MANELDVSRDSTAASRMERLLAAVHQTNADADAAHAIIHSPFCASISDRTGTLRERIRVAVVKAASPSAHASCLHTLQPQTTDADGDFHEQIFEGQRSISKLSLLQSLFTDCSSMTT